MLKEDIIFSHPPRFNPRNNFMSFGYMLFPSLLIFFSFLIAFKYFIWWSILIALWGIYHFSISYRKTLQFKTFKIINKKTSKNSQKIKELNEWYMANNLFLSLKIGPGVYFLVE